MNIYCNNNQSKRKQMCRVLNIELVRVVKEHTLDWRARIRGMFSLNQSIEHTNIVDASLH